MRVRPLARHERLDYIPETIVLIGASPLGSQMPRLSYLGVSCILIVVFGALALAWISPMEPDDAVAGSVFAAFVATSVTILSGRFPI
jgi:hypothetical protein